LRGAILSQLEALAREPGTIKYKEQLNELLGLHK